MLCLTRRESERIRVGSDIVITVLEVMGNKVKLGITAPPQVPIHREEVWLEIQDERAGDGCD